MKDFLFYLKKYSELLKVEAKSSRPALFAGLGVAAFGLLPAFLQQRIFDVAIPLGDLKVLAFILWGLLGTYLIQACGETLLSFTEARLVEQADFKVKGTFFNHLLHLPQRYFDQTTPGEIQKLWEDSGKVSECFQLLAFTGGRTLFSLMIYLPVLFCISPWLTLIKLLGFPISLGLGRMFSQKDRMWEQDIWAQSGKLHTAFTEGILGIKTLKAFGGEVSQRRIWQRFLLGLRRTGWKRRIWKALWGVSSQLTGQLFGALFFFVAGWGLVDGWLSFGGFLAFNTLSGLGLGALQSLVDGLGNLMKNLNPLGRLEGLMSLEPEISPLRRSNETLSILGGLEFRNLSFSYGPEAIILDKIQLDIPQGCKVGVVGPSGSGKSTLVNLVMGYLKPTHGSVLVDGVDLQNYPLESLRGRIGLVLQENFFFHRSLRDNLLMGRQKSEEDIYNALVRSQSLEFIYKIPGRLEAHYGNGGLGLSGGQKQRLAIARAFLQDPAILILDEATSALDGPSEWAIQEALEELCQQRTSLVIAHRLTTVMNADLIYYLRDGKIEGQGAHNLLLETCLGYRDLWRVQEALR